MLHLLEWAVLTVRITCQFTFCLLTFSPSLPSLYTSWNCKELCFLIGNGTLTNLISSGGLLLLVCLFLYVYYEVRNVTSKEGKAAGHAGVHSYNLLGTYG